MTAPPLFDTHAHLHFPELVADLEGVLQLQGRDSYRVLEGAPHLYVYVSHGENSWDQGHHRMLADRLGPRLMLAFVVTLWSAMTALTGAAWNLASLVTIRFLFGISEAGAYPGGARAICARLPAPARRHFLLAHPLRTPARRRPLRRRP